MAQLARTLKAGHLALALFMMPLLTASAQDASHGIANSSSDASPLHTDADVRFMQQMIPHHAQALEMSVLVPQRTGKRDLHLLAERIDVSQRDEITFMQSWLERRNEEAPTVNVHHGSMEHHNSTDHHEAGHNHDAGETHHSEGGHQADDHESCGCDMQSGEVDHFLMPGMLTPQEMDKLASATGPDFERLFLEYMIRHHEGALTMVADLLGSEGAAQESEIFRFASDVDADQRAEIKRMGSLLELQP